MASVTIEEIIFKGGFKHKLDKNSIVVFVGPNNSGKSATLNDIWNHLRSDAIPSITLVENIVLSKNGTFEDLKLQVENRRKENQYYTETRHAVNESQLEKAWDSYPTTRSVINKFFVKHLSTQDRLGLVNPPENLNFLEAMPSHPIHFLKEDKNLELEFGRYFKRAFGQDLIVNHTAGNIVPLHVGNRPTVTLKKDIISKEYQSELRSLPLLHNQGDGMKSFAGVFLSLFVENYLVNLIDEPEAFLHPPQARLLGQMIARNLKNDKQIFIATHSEHLLKGLLDHAGKRLAIIRIQRHEDVATLSTLQNSEIANIWSDSLLRHSNILDGLFHKEVVICESDSDCRFFSALVTEITEKIEDSSQDIHFVQSGGKHRFPVVIAALKKLNVPIKVIGDIDLLNNEQPLRKMFEMMGGSWSSLEKDFKIVKSAIDEKKPELLAADLNTKINSLFDASAKSVVTEDQVKAIKSLLKKASPWEEAKNAGKLYLPSGDATASFNKLIGLLEEKSIIVLEVGEIEAFDKTVGGHGPKWVSGVLSKPLLTSPDLKVARDFVNQKLLTGNKV